MSKRNPQKRNRANLKIRRFIYYILGVLEVFFGFRLILKVLGSNPESTFVNIVYSVSGVFMAPFTGIFRAVATEGIETEAILEPSLIIAMIVYALIAYGIVRLIEIMTNRRNI